MTPPGTGESPASKADLRRSLRARLAAMTEAERAASSAIILEHARKIVPASGLVLAFEPLPDEPDIGPLIEHCRQSGRLALVVGRGEAARIEPRGPIAIALVPGRAFSRDGARLGRGGGTFDRILSALSCPKVGIAFACQVVASIPTEPHDIRMDQVISA